MSVHFERPANILDTDNGRVVKAYEARVGNNDLACNEAPSSYAKFPRKHETPKGAMG